jgi:hypothetical protein
VRKVFSSSIDLVVHLDRRTDPSDTTIHRQTMEIRAVVPALHNDFSSEPIFVRERVGAPLEWTGATPPSDFVDRVERNLPSDMRLADVLERGVMQW